MDIHGQFQKGLIDSIPSVHKVAGWMEGLGALVLIKPTRVAPTVGDREDYRDDGDLEIRMDVEVKHRDLEWTGVDDYPFPTVYINKRELIDAKPFMRLHSYIIVNRGGDRAIIVKPNTRKQWLVEKTKCKLTGGEYEVYAVPKVMCRWVEL